MIGNCTISEVKAVVFGSSGFIGEHLLKVLLARKYIEVRKLVRLNNVVNQEGNKCFDGDFRKSDSLNRLLDKYCTVVNLISDDDSRVDNFRDVEDRLLASFGKSCSVPRISIPKFFLGAFLCLVGKSIANTSKKYSDHTLTIFGYKKPQDLEAAITAFAMRNKYSKSMDGVRYVI